MIKSILSLFVNDIHTVVVLGIAGVAPILDELFAQTVTVLNEYILTSAAVIGELAVLDEVAVADVEYTDCAAYVVSLVAFKGAVADAGFERCTAVFHTGANEDRACLVVRVVVLEGRAFYGEVFAPNCAAPAFL